MATAPPPEAAPRRERRWAWPTLGLILAAGLGLRLWGLSEGLPYVYNDDEAQHFVPHAIEMFQHHTLNPGYFANPPAFTYLLHAIFFVWYGGAGGAVHAYQTDPGSAFRLARLAAALLGVLALWLLYLLGARLFSRAVGLLAAAVEAVAFLPVFYGHLALNDVPTLAPATLSLLGSAGVLRRGRARDHLIAGIGLGLACATKYTAGIVVLPYLAAVFARQVLPALRARRKANLEAPAAAAETGPAAPHAPRGLLLGAGLALLAAVLAFWVANPYSLLDYSAFHAELVHQSKLSAESQGKLGAPKDGGVIYYLWVLTWGLGWVPALAALGGAVAIWWRERALGWMLVPAPILFLILMGSEGRYFGRWLMPIMPLLCLLAAFFALAAVARLLALVPRRGALSRADGDATRQGRPRAAQILAGAGTALVVVLLLAQGAVYSIHSGVVLSKPDTRALTRDWMLAHIPAGARVVLEPVSPEQWAFGTVDQGRCEPGRPFIWCVYPALNSHIDPNGALTAGFEHTEVGIEDYVRTLAPSLLGYYRQKGYCWVVTGSTQRDRAFADPRAVPLAVAYYRALESEGEVVHVASPYGSGAGPVAFNFDWSFEYYNLAYSRPGPLMTVYRLHGGRCGS